jgi:hypothetical protein
MADIVCTVTHVCSGVLKTINATMSTTFRSFICSYQFTFQETVTKTDRLYRLHVIYRRTFNHRLQTDWCLITVTSFVKVHKEDMAYFMLPSMHCRNTQHTNIISDCGKN